NEQIVTAPRIIRAKWDELLSDLRRDLNDPEARFAFVFLVDDFIASGTTLLRQNDGAWTGKLVRFWEDLREAGVGASHFDDEWVLCVHHYVATHRATQVAKQRHEEAQQSRGSGQWFERVRFSNGMVLPEGLPLDEERHRGFLALVEQYYDDSIETKHMK